MRHRNLLPSLVLLLCVAACSKSSTAPTPVATLTTPTPTSPTNGTQIANLAQPVTLSVNNAALSGGTAAVVYTFEVATDSAFANKVVTKDVPETPGQTSLKLDPLPAGKDYFWHARATAGSAVGSFSTTLMFTIGAALVIQPPTPALPTNGSTVASARPTLTITNSSRTGAAGAITYLFEIATDPGFANVVASGTVPEGAAQTTFTPSSNLSYKTTHYWHARANDTTVSVSTAFSTASSFVTPDQYDDLWPGKQPPGTTGHAIKGDNWQRQLLISFDGEPFESPTLEMRRVFDLLDHDFDPQGAIDWMHNNGYPTVAAWFPQSQTIGFDWMYMAFINGRWDLILRNE